MPVLLESHALPLSIWNGHNWPFSWSLLVSAIFSYMPCLTSWHDHVCSHLKLSVKTLFSYLCFVALSLYIVCKYIPMFKVCIYRGEYTEPKNPQDRASLLLLALSCSFLHSNKQLLFYCLHNRSGFSHPLHILQEIRVCLLETRKLVKKKLTE